MVSTGGLLGDVKQAYRLVARGTDRDHLYAPGLFDEVLEAGSKALSEQSVAAIGGFFVGCLRVLYAGVGGNVVIALCMWSDLDRGDTHGTHTALNRAVLEVRETQRNVVNFSPVWQANITYAIHLIAHAISEMGASPWQAVIGVIDPDHEHSFDKRGSDE